MRTLAEIVSQVAPHADPVYLAGLATCEPQLEKRGITTPLRRTNLLCQMMGETDGFTIVQESGTYTHASRVMEIFGVGRHSAAITQAEADYLVALPRAQRGPALFERVYGLGNPRKARELGNTVAGDGWLFRGIGPLQSTGRGAAVTWGERCGADFAANVMLMVAPQYVMLPPLLEWEAGGLNTWADHDDVRHIRRVINGGYNGIDIVQDWHDRLWPLMRAANDNFESWQAARPAAPTVQLQRDLNDLGYAPALKTDGRYGPATREAVCWFQKIAGLKVDGAAGPVTNAAIETALRGFHMPTAAEAA